ncbi:single-stranded DNA-binding protein [Microbacterium immunditiarum]|uniref:Single-strand DNA-binding protein n=1 Tax=Microbacterium immunditiarum TaxID=337480 RepID=A0A7Y9GPB5_9MICO|nr:single-stranded DNA-binding protein [Microbacterium immunditiarum]NYE20188.1 single-strand DNA-binding protein [Microbacterium immunditiarum]
MSETITVTGIVATPPELRRSSAGVPIASFRLAAGQRRYDRATNTWVDNGTNWYSVSAFRALAENSIASLRKNDRVVVTGKLRVRDWDNGVKRGTDVDVDADAIGHDLRWGVSRFARPEAPAAPNSNPEDAWAPDESGGAGAEGETADAAPDALETNAPAGGEAWGTPDDPVLADGEAAPASESAMAVDVPF